MNVRRQFILYGFLMRKGFMERTDREEYLAAYETLKDVLDQLWVIDHDLWRKYELGGSRKLKGHIEKAEQLERELQARQGEEQRQEAERERLDKEAA